MKSSTFVTNKYIKQAAKKIGGCACITARGKD